MHACYHACMGQVTWRASEELINRVRAAASTAGRSMNDYVTVVLEAATDPALGGTEAERVRERLALAGLLAPVDRSRRRPPATRVAAARRAAGRGASISELVGQDRG